MLFYINIANIFLRSLDFFHSKMSPTPDIRGIYARHFFLDLRRGSFTAYSHAIFLKKTYDIYAILIGLVLMSVANLSVRPELAYLTFILMTLLFFLFLCILRVVYFPS